MDIWWGLKMVFENINSWESIFWSRILKKVMFLNLALHQGLHEIQKDRRVQQVFRQSDRIRKFGRRTCGNGVGFGNLNVFSSRKIGELTFSENRLLFSIF